MYMYVFILSLSITKTDNKTLFDH